MTRKVLSILLFTVAAALTAGCSTTGGGAVIGPNQGRHANLLLGPYAADTQVATEMAGRSDWPSTTNGYRFNDTTYYSEWQYDYQSHFDRFGGLYAESDTVRTGVRVR